MAVRFVSLTELLLDERNIGWVCYKLRGPSRFEQPMHPSNGSHWQITSRCHRNVRIFIDNGNCKLNPELWTCGKFPIKKFLSPSRHMVHLTLPDLWGSNFKRLEFSGLKSSRRSVIPAFSRKTQRKFRNFCLEEFLLRRAHLHGSLMNCSLTAPVGTDAKLNYHFFRFLFT